MSLMNKKDSITNSITKTIIRMKRNFLKKTRNEKEKKRTKMKSNKEKRGTKMIDNLTSTTTTITNNNTTNK